MSSDFEYIYEFYRDRGLSDEVGYVLSVGRPMGKLILHLEIPNDPESIISPERREWEIRYERWAKVESRLRHMIWEVTMWPPKEEEE